jgi:hypothetical protein
LADAGTDADADADAGTDADADADADAGTDADAGADADAGTVVLALAVPGFIELSKVRTSDVGTALLLVYYILNVFNIKFH